MANTFYYDPVAYNGYIAAARTATAATFANKWKGYIYEFIVYQDKHTNARTTHAATCTSGCETIEFNEYTSGSTCASTSCDDRSCVRSSTCRATGSCEASFNFCHICNDLECKECSDYTTCDVGKCGNSGLAVSGAANICECGPNSVRTGAENSLCLACHTGCSTCTTGALTNFSDCTACVTQKIPSSYTAYCSACPTGFTGASCSLPGSALVLNLNFNIPKGVFTNTGTATA
jgi:hypothetical protein